MEEKLKIKLLKFVIFIALIDLIDDDNEKEINHFSHQISTAFINAIKN